MRRLRARGSSVIMTLSPGGFLAETFLQYQSSQLAFRMDSENQLLLSLMIINNYSFTDSQILVPVFMRSGIFYILNISIYLQCYIKGPHMLLLAMFLSSKYFCCHSFIHVCHSPSFSGCSLRTKTFLLVPHCIPNA